MSCYGCEKRHIGCHATCEDYLKYRAERDALNEQIKAEKIKDRNAISTAIQGMKNRKLTGGRLPLKNRLKKKEK